MHTPDEQAWGRSDLQQEVEVENVEDHRAGGPRSTVEIVIRHVDLSEPVSIGPWNVSGSLVGILQACETHLPEFLRSLEARIPAERRAAFSSAYLWGPIYSDDLVVTFMVSDSEVE